MKLTTDYLKEKFHVYNDLIFEGRLPEPKLRVSRARTRLGSMSCRRTFKRSLSQFVKGRLGFTDFSISVSTYYDMTEDQVDDVLIHEMIHYSIAYTGLKDTSSHGVIFREMMNSINKKYGRHIQVMTSTKGWRTTVKPRSKTFLVLGLKMHDGRYFLSSVNPRFAGDMEIRLNHAHEVEKHQWLETKDEYFRSFPQCRSLRGRGVSAEVFAEFFPDLQ